MWVHALILSHLCDNAGVSALSGKMLTASEPLYYVLQAIRFYCCHLGVALHSNHIAAGKNHWADALSRGNIPGRVLQQQASVAGRLRD